MAPRRGAHRVPGVPDLSGRPAARKGGRLNKFQSITHVRSKEPKASTDYKRVARESLESLRNIYSPEPRSSLDKIWVNLIDEVLHLRQENGELQQRMGHLQYDATRLCAEAEYLDDAELTRLAEDMRQMAWGEAEMEDS